MSNRTPKIILSGKLVDVRNYATAKSVRLIIEIPAERAARAIAEFGWATPVAPVPVAVARLDPEKAAPEPPRLQEKAIEEKPKLVEKERRAWSDMPPPQQAGIRCGELAFQRFLLEMYPLSWRKQAEEGGMPMVVAGRVVRMICGVESRSEILRDTPAALTWHHLDVQYQNWMRGYGEVAA